MHEVSIAESVISTVKQTLEGREYTSIKEINLEIGELTFISEEALHFAFKILVENTPLEGTILIIKNIEGSVSCVSCGYKGPIQRIDDEKWHTSAPILSCPDCEEIVDITGGQDMVVRNIKLEVE